MRRASVTCFPRIRSATRRAFLGETRTNFAIAFASISYPSARRCHQSSQCSCSLQRGAALGVVAVGPEDPCRSKLSELVADHRLGDENRYMLAAVVHRD